MSKHLQYTPPEYHYAWNLYGAGYGHLGREGAPEKVKTPRPGPDQILVRMDSIGICYSDVKLLNQGNTHAKISGRDLAAQPTRPGHEACFTVSAVGEELQGSFQIGERYALQPEVVLGGKKHTYGFSIPGGLTQYQLVGPELLATDQGPSILKLEASIGYAEAALLEPWGSVLAAYAGGRRLIPKEGGRMWIVGNGSSAVPYSFSRFLDLPAALFVTDPTPSLQAALGGFSREISKADGTPLEGYQELIRRHTDGEGFDDIVILEPASADQVQRLVDLVNPGGLINLVGGSPLQRAVHIDPRRIHYESVGLVGNPGPEIAASYGPDRNRSDLKPGGIAALFGGGGPIGQMHLLYALTKEDGPATILVLETNRARIDHLRRRFAPLARNGGKELIIIDPDDAGPELNTALERISGGRAPDDLIVLVPRQDVLDLAADLAHDHSLINLFAGTPAGLHMPLEASGIYLGGLQLTGHSGLGMAEYRAAYELVKGGRVDLNASVAAVGGMRAASAAIKAAEERRFAGKTIIYPQLEDLPLLSVPELAASFPEISQRLGELDLWTREAEAALLELAG
jgi:threonine dehydrogenase-like Zn-dependent dehydrogenase